MYDREIRAALERHWEASRAGDQDAEHEIYHDDAVVEYPQSGERVRGRQNVQPFAVSIGQAVGLCRPADRWGNPGHRVCDRL